MDSDGGTGAGFGGVAGCLLPVRLCRLLHAGLSPGRLAAVVLVRRDLLARSQQRYRNRSRRLGDEVLLGIGRKSIGNDLHPDCTAGRNHIDGGLTLRVCLDLEIALISAFQQRAEDNGRVGDGLAVGLLGNKNLDV